MVPNILEAKLRFLLEVFRRSLAVSGKHAIGEVFKGADVPSPPFTPEMLALGLEDDRLVRLHDDENVSISSVGYSLCEALADVSDGELKMMVKMSNTSVVATFANRERLSAGIVTLADMGGIEMLANKSFRGTSSTPVFVKLCPLAKLYASEYKEPV